MNQHKGTILHYLKRELHVMRDKDSKEAQELKATIGEVESWQPQQPAMPQADWSLFPASAKWWAVEPDGRIVVSDEDMPVVSGGAWFAPHGLRSYLDGGGLPFRVNIPIGTDWRTTLQARPTDTEANDA